MAFRVYNDMKKTILSIVAIAAFLPAWTSFGQSGTGFRAGTGTISSPFVLTNDYVFQPIQTGVTNGGRAVYSFSLTNSGQFVILAVAEAPSQDANSLFVNIDSEPKDPEMIWEIPVASGFKTNLVSTSLGKPRYFDLSSGSHEIIIRGREPNVKLLHLQILARLSPVTGLRVVSSP
jgi:hypothetical protein